jgi:hypothetical protein
LKTEKIKPDARLGSRHRFKANSLDEQIQLPQPAEYSMRQATGMEHIHAYGQISVKAYQHTRNIENGQQVPCQSRLEGPKNRPQEKKGKNRNNDVGSSDNESHAKGKQSHTEAFTREVAKIRSLLVR